MIVTDILLDGLFAAVAAIGFGAISDPPMRAFPRIALLAAIGHALRFTLIHCAALDIATASLSVIALLAAGATLPIFIFKRRAFSMTRRTRKNS